MTFESMAQVSFLQVTTIRPLAERPHQFWGAATSG